MKKFFTLLLAVASLAAVSCQKEQDKTTETNSEKGLVKVSFRAQYPEVSGDTKTSINENGRLFWSKGDHICVWDGTDYRDFDSEITGDDPVKEATFVGSIQSGATDFIAVYPYVEPYNAGVSYDEGKIVTSIPTTQYAVVGSFANQANVAVATGVIDSEVLDFGTEALADFTFSNVGALVKFHISQNNVHKGVTLKAFTKPAEEKIYAKIAGEVKITPATAVAVATENSETAVSVEAKEGYLAEGDYYAVILPVEGQKIEFTFTDGTNTKKRSSQAPITVGRSHFYDMGTIDDGISYPEPAPATGWIATDLSEITAEDVFVIVGYDGEDYYALPNDNGTSAPVVVAVTVEDNKLAGTVADNVKWNVSGNATDGYTLYPDGDTESWLYCSTTKASGSNNNICVGTGPRKVFVLDSNNYLVTNDDYVDRYLSIYNSQDWRGYINTNSAVAITFFKYFDTPDTRDEAGMSWSADDVTATYSNGNVVDFTAPTLTPGNATGITYESTDETIATINESGDVTLKALSDNNIDVTVGSTTIKAIFAGDGSYKPQTVTYTLTVVDSRDAVATPGFSPAAGEVAENTVVSFTCETSDVTYYYTVNDDTPTTASTQGSSVTINAPKTVKVIATKTGYKPSAVATASYTVSGGNDGSLAHPYTATDVLGIASAENVYVTGTIKSISEVSTTYHNATYTITDETSDALVFRGKYLNNADFTSADQIKVGDVVIVYGNIGQYDNVSQLSQGNYIYSINGKTKALSAGTLTATADNANKQITVTWGAATGTDSAISYVVTCGTQNFNADAAGNHTFTMTEYGTYDVTVVASADDAISATAATTATLTDPSAGTSKHVATINFGSATGSTNINAASKTGQDSEGNTWTITTEGTDSFTPNANYAQIGSSKKPATSITFTTTLSSSATDISLEAKFGGFSGTAGTVNLKVGDNTIGSGSLNATNDVTVKSTSTGSGTVLTVTVTGISKGVKAYYIKATYTN